PARACAPPVAPNQPRQPRRGRRGLKREGFRHVFTLGSAEAVAAATIVRQPLWNDRRTEHGPFDVIGDVHGCATELEQLLGLLGYVAEPGEDGAVYAHPEGRTAV